MQVVQGIQRGNTDLQRDLSVSAERTLVATGSKGCRVVHVVTILYIQKNVGCHPVNVLHHRGTIIVKLVANFYSIDPETRSSNLTSSTRTET